MENVLHIVIHSLNFRLFYGYGDTHSNQSSPMDKNVEEVKNRNFCYSQPTTHHPCPLLPRRDQREAGLSLFPGWPLVSSFNPQSHHPVLPQCCSMALDIFRLMHFFPFPAIQTPQGVWLESLHVTTEFSHRKDSAFKWTLKSDESRNHRT